MTMTRKKMIAELRALEEPQLIQEGDIQTDNILQVISSQGGYRLEVDAFPIDGPFEISLDEYHMMSKMNAELFPLVRQLKLSPEEAMPIFRRMVANVAGCNHDDHSNDVGFMLDLLVC